MSTPEIIPDQPPQQEVAPRVEQPIVPETAQQLGVTAPQQAPAPLVSQDDNQVLVQPVPITPVDDTPTLAVPAAVAMSEKDLEKGATGPANLSITWLDAFWLREVGKALVKGWKVMFGQQ